MVCARPFFSGSPGCVLSSACTWLFSSQHSPEPAAQAAQPAERVANCMHHRPVRLSWSRLLKRAFNLDLEHCPNCGGELKIIAAILEQPVIEKILTHLELQARAPPRAAARGHSLQAV